jgi:hypothetical protein
MVTIPEFTRTINYFSLEVFMQFIGIDLHTNRFTCCYRDESPGSEGTKMTETFELSAYGMAQFYTTLTPETYVLIEAAITTFCFARLIQPLVKEVIVANTDKIDADILCRTLKMQVLSGVETISPVTIPPVEIQELRAFFTTYRLFKKQTTQTKNRIHCLRRRHVCFKRNTQR